MSEQITSKSLPRSKEEEEEEEFVLLVDSIIAEQCCEEQALQEETPTENKDIATDKEDEGEPQAEAADPEADIQEGKTGGKEDDLDVKGEFVPSLEAAEMPEEDEKMNHVNIE